MIIERMNKEINMNEVVGLEEAQKILEILKRHYPGIFDGLEIKYGDYYCYNERTHTVYIQSGLGWTDEEIRSDCAIIDIVNEKYGLNLEKNARCISMHALLHELGHAADLSYKKAFGRYEEYMESEEQERIVFESKKHAYYNMREELDEVYNEIIELNPIGNEIKIAELNEKREELEKEIEQLENELDREYREIATEAAADKFCACLLKGMCRNII